jgi:hypothetical protein
MTFSFASRYCVAREAGMREVRIVLVMVSPLLAGLIHHVVASGLKHPDARLAIVDETDDLEDLPHRLAAIHPDLVVIGPAGADVQRAASSAASHLRVITLSADLQGFEGPGRDDAVAFSVETLTQRLGQMLNEH